MTGMGSSGCLLVYSCGDANVGEMLLYDPLAGGGTWTKLSGVPGSPGGDYHSCLVYSVTKNVAIFGGPNQRATTVTRLNSDKTMTQLTLFTPGWGVTRSVTVADPVMSTPVYPLMTMPAVPQPFLDA